MVVKIITSGASVEGAREASRDRPYPSPPPPFPTFLFTPGPTCIRRSGLASELQLSTEVLMHP